MTDQSNLVSLFGCDNKTLPIVALVVCDGFGPYQFSVPCVVFGNYVTSDTPLFDLRVCSAESGLLHSDYGLQIATPYGLEAIEAADIIVIPFWRDLAERPSDDLLEALVMARKRGAKIVGLCFGGYVLAYAGLLDNRNAATHWQAESDFATRFPNVKLDTNALYIDDEGVITSAGTGAGLDCCLHIVRQIYGSTTANRISQWLVIPSYREGEQAQIIEHPTPMDNRDIALSNLLEDLRANLADEHDLDSVAERVGMSRRTFTRRFFKATGTSLGQWLTTERLHRCQELLETTPHGIDKIAEIIGFNSACTLRQQFKRKFGVPPREWRRNYQQPL